VCKLTCALPAAHPSGHRPHAHLPTSLLSRRKNVLPPTDISRTVQKECLHTGSFATAQCPSPIKWGDDKYRRHGFPSRPLLDIRRKRDPTEWENDGVGPSDFSTSFGVSWRAPGEQEDRCNARASLSTSSSAALEKASLTSGWRENNTNREHPWIHPGVPETTETTYRLTNRVPAKRGGRSDIAPMTTSGYARSARKIVFGNNLLLPEEKISTTHLNYMAGRTNLMSGMTFELAPNTGPGEQGFSQSGFSKNLPHPQEVFPRAPEAELPLHAMYSTSTSDSFIHPGRFSKDKMSVVDGGEFCLLFHSCSSRSHTICCKQAHARAARAHALSALKGSITMCAPRQRPAFPLHMAVLSSPSIVCIRSAHRRSTSCTRR
jgi:hypothetical protein